MKTVARILLLLGVALSFGIRLMADESAAAEQAPETYQVLFETSKGDFTVEVHREWSPNGAKPSASRRELSPKLMNTWLVREFFCELFAYVMNPRLFD